MRTIDRRNAISLRQEGKTYSEIRRILHIPKSTLSDWLKGYILSHNELKNLEKSIHHSRDIANEKTRKTKQRNKDLRLKNIYKEEKIKLLPLNRRELYIAGLLLYLGEGNKGDNSTICVNNTDPSVVKFFCYWLTHTLHIQKVQLRVGLHLYKDMSIHHSILYWSNYLNIPREQFIKPYIKDSNRTEIDQKGFGHGTCGIYVYDRVMKLQIMAGMNVITGMV